MIATGPIATFAAIAAAYLIGSIPFGLMVGRAFFKTDIRTSGSGNIGAANALRTFGRKAGIAVLVLDALKGAAAVWLTAAVAGAAFAPLGGLAAMAGHCYSPWLRFSGGKGVATFLGAVAAISWEAALAFAAVWMVIVLPSGLSSLGSMVATLAAGAIVAATSPNAGSAALFAVASALLVVWKHRENIARLRAGTENRLKLLKR